MKCNKDCFNCKYTDCIAHIKTYSEKSRYGNRPETQKQYQREYQKKKRDVARMLGNCIICQKKPATNGSKCYECYIRQKRYDKAKYDGVRQQWKDNGLCYYCGAPVLPNKRTCKKHYEIYRCHIAKVNNLAQTKKAQHKFGRDIWRLKDVGL